MATKTLSSSVKLLSWRLIFGAKREKKATPWQRESPPSAAACAHPAWGRQTAALSSPFTTTDSTIWEPLQTDFMHMDTSHMNKSRNFLRRSKTQLHAHQFCSNPPATRQSPLKPKEPVKPVKPVNTYLIPRGDSSRSKDHWGHRGHSCTWETGQRCCCAVRAEKRPKHASCARPCAFSADTRVGVWVWRHAIGQRVASENRWRCYLVYDFYSGTALTSALFHQLQAHVTSVGYSQPVMSSSHLANLNGCIKDSTGLLCLQMDILTEVCVVSWKFWHVSVSTTDVCGWVSDIIHGAAVGGHKSVCILRGVVCFWQHATK